MRVVDDDGEARARDPLDAPGGGAPTATPAAIVGRIGRRAPTRWRRRRAMFSACGAPDQRTGERQTDGRRGRARRACRRACSRPRRAGRRPSGSRPTRTQPRPDTSPARRAPAASSTLTTAAASRLARRAAAARGTAAPWRRSTRRRRRGSRGGRASGCVKAAASKRSRPARSQRQRVRRHLHRDVRRRPPARISASRRLQLRRLRRGEGRGPLVAAEAIGDRADDARSARPAARQMPSSR